MNSDDMQGYWTNFARTGDPNGEGLVEWPSYEAETDRPLVLDNPVSPDCHLQNDAFDFRDAFLNQR